MRYKITKLARLELLHYGSLNVLQQDILAKELGCQVSKTGTELVGKQVSEEAYREALIAKENLSAAKKKKAAMKKSANKARKDEIRNSITLQVERNLAEMGLREEGKFTPGFAKTTRTKEADVKAAIYGMRGKLSKIEMDDFRRSLQWKQLRYEALKRSRGCCDCCGARATPGKPLHVDHIEPIAAGGEPDSIANLQVLCADCNEGKGSWDNTDWRSVSALRENFAADIDQLSDAEREHLRSIMH
jgi:hypothetical protein